MLGRGACGSVHSVSRDGGACAGGGGGAVREYAVKIAPLPPSLAAGGGGRKKRKKKTPAERNADLLHYENNLYRNVLNDVRGRDVPDVPHAGDRGPPGYGDVEGE